ncbi:PREDICTED: cytochrome b5 isoform X3 [Eufriesea mexicana]|uniref:cytochrome b5 isoform X3 n=1 Tax=Eufriesea mexicana TaxID=516756 RepID=UPI00083BE7C2|nr:PREDICTED: cytochrome b5 isoform X3 [Eufriesea mexicana]
MEKSRVFVGIPDIFRILSRSDIFEIPHTSNYKEVAQHDGKDGANVWIVIYDMVYDVTEYKDKHPGGPELIEEYAGQDATRGFDEFGHSSDAKRMLKKFLVGELVEDDKVRNRRKKNDNTVEINPEIRSGRRRFLSVLCFKCVT